jgi:hypothetical protein
MALGRPLEEQFRPRSQDLQAHGFAILLRPPLHDRLQDVRSVRNVLSIFAQHPNQGGLGLPLGHVGVLDAPNDRDAAFRPLGVLSEQVFDENLEWGKVLEFDGNAGE